MLGGIDGPARLCELCGGGLQRSFAGQDDHEGCDLTKGHVPHNAGGITGLKQQQFRGVRRNGTLSCSVAVAPC